MSRIEIDEVAWRVFSRSLLIRVASEATAMVYEHGTEDEATVYEAETGEDTLTQPLDVDAHGRIDGYVDPGSYLDLFVQHADGSYAQPWVAGDPELEKLYDTGFMQNLKIGESAYAADDLPDGVFIGVPPSPDPASGTTIAVVGAAYLPDVNRWNFGAAVNITEPNDVAEVSLRRPPGFHRHGPVGGSTPLAGDVASSATTFYVVRGDWFPFAVSTALLPVGVTFEVDGQAVTYTLKEGVPARISGTHAIGATSVIVADGSGFPAAGLVDASNTTLAYTACTKTLDTTVNGLHLAGSTTLTLNSVAGLATSGTIRALGTGAEWENLRYTSIAGNVLTLHSNTPLPRNMLNATTAEQYTLTGVTTVRKTPVQRKHYAGEPKLGIGFVNGFPASGTVDVTGLGEVDYSEISGGKLVLAEPLAADVPATAWVSMDDATGLVTALVDYATVRMDKMTGAAGFTVGKSARSQVEFNPRHKAPLPKNTGIGYIGGHAWGADGSFRGRAAQLQFETPQDVWTGYESGRWVLAQRTNGPNGVMRQNILGSDRGVGFLGGDVFQESQIDYPWEFSRRGARVIVQGAVELEPDDPDYVEGYQLMSSTLIVNTTRGWPTAGRLRITVYNRDLGTAENREFDYTGLGANNNTFTGITYDGTGGYTLTDFVAVEGEYIRPADRFQHINLASYGQIAANVEQSGQVIVGNVGPTTAAPEPGVKMGTAVVHENATTHRPMLATEALMTFMTGTAAARPAAGSAGRAYHASDTGAVSLDTGSAWVALT